MGNAKASKSKTSKGTDSRAFRLFNPRQKGEALSANTYPHGPAKEDQTSISTCIIGYYNTITINVDGEPKVIEVTYLSDQLPVMAGNEVEIVAKFDEKVASSYVCFTMPDGTKQIVTKAYPKCKWTVPTNFVSGDKVYAQWADNNGKIIHPNLSSSIAIITLEK